MVESVGKKLHQARLQRGLTVDEAAHATKLRPDKIAALEADDYARFPNNTYAKGFLQIYGRFLKVDVEEFARTLDNSNPISISDYQYLTNAPAAKTETIAVRRDERRPPSLAPLLFFIVIIGLGLFGWWLRQTYLRVGGETTAKGEPSQQVIPAPTPNPDAAFINALPPMGTTPSPKGITPHPGVATPAIVPRIVAATPGASTSVPPAAGTPRMQTPAPVAVATPRATTPAPLAATTPRSATPPPFVAVNPHSATPAPLPGATPAARPPEQDFVKPSPVTTNDNATRPAGMNEVLVATVKKTWVTIRKDDPKALPIFEDYVYPNANPLKLKGARFFIEARDPSAVQITKNGLPYAYQASGVPIQ